MIRLITFAHDEVEDRDKDRTAADTGGIGHGCALSSGDQGGDGLDV